MALHFHSERQSIAEYLEKELKSLFAQPSAPQYPFPLTSAVARLTEVLEQRLGDPELDAVGPQVAQGIVNYKSTGEVGNLPDRLEPFLKFIYRLIKGGASNGTLGRDRMFLPDVLLNLGLISAVKETEDDLSAAAGRPRFAWQVIRAVRARNEVHRAPVYTSREKVEVFESVCGVMLFAVCEHFNAIDNALLALSQRDLLEQYQEDFAKWCKRVVDLEGAERTDVEFEGVDPLAFELPQSDVEGKPDLTDGPETPGDGADDLETTSQARSGLVKSLVQQIPKIVLLGDAGAGKSTTLQYLAWQSATTLLKRPTDDTRLPVYIQLKLMSSAGAKTLEEAINRELSGLTFEELRHRRCLLLLDGLNEVPQELIQAVKMQIQRLLTTPDNVHVVITCRPSQFHNEFSVPVFELKSLSNQQILNFLLKQLRDTNKADALIRIIRPQPKLWEWARNPFMLAMVVRVYSKTGALPNNRGSLLRSFLEDIMKRERIQGSAKIPIDVKITLLARLAFDTRKKALLSFGYLDATGIIKTRRDEIGSNADLPAFIEEVINNNLLSRTRSGLITFDHELYQELLCAIALIELGDAAPPLIAELHDEASWEEPIILYYGLSQAKELILALLLETNVFLAAKCLKSAVDSVTALRGVVLKRAYEIASTTAEPEELAKGLLSLAELGDRNTIIDILKQRGGSDSAANRAISSLVTRLQADEVMDWIHEITQHTDRYLVNWVCNAITPEQTESLFRGHRSQLEAVILDQAKRAWRTDREAKHLGPLWRKWGNFFAPTLGQLIASRLILDEREPNTENWAALRQLIALEPGLNLGPKCKELFVLALTQPHRSALFIAAHIWSEHWDKKAIDSIVIGVGDLELKRAMRQLRKPKQLTHFELSIAISQLLRDRGLNRAVENAETIQTSISRLERLAELKVGQILTNCVISRRMPFGAFIKLDSHNDALIHTSDITWEAEESPQSAADLCEPVDTVVLEVEDWSGHVLLGAKQVPFARWKQAALLYPEGSTVYGNVRSIEKGDITVELEGGIFGLIRRADYVKRKECIGIFSSLTIDGEICAQVLSKDSNSMRLLLSLSATTQNSLPEVRRLISVGDQFQGEVYKVVDFGVFVKIGPDATGLMHRSQLGALGDSRYIKKAFTKGQIIDVNVIDVSSENQRISLGLVKPPPDPWSTITDRFSAGMVVDAQISHWAPYGIFAEIEPFVCGLIHITEIGWFPVKNPKDHIVTDRPIKVCILDIDVVSKKVALSIKRLHPDPWEVLSSDFRIGCTLSGVIVKAVSFGIYVEVEGGITGIIHYSSLSGNLTARLLETAVVGDKIEVIVQTINLPQRRLQLVPANSSGSEEKR